MSTTIVGSTANVAQTVIYNAVGCSVSISTDHLGYAVLFGPQTSNPSPVQMPTPWLLGSPFTKLDQSFSSILTSQNYTAPVTGATNASPIVLTVPTTSGLTSGQVINVSGVTGNTAANGTWTVGTGAFLTSTTITLPSSTGNGAFTGGGTVTGPSVNVTLSVPSVSSGVMTIPAAFWTALALAQPSSGLDPKTASFLAWVAFWDYVRQGGQ